MELTEGDQDRIPDSFELVSNSDRNFLWFTREVGEDFEFNRDSVVLYQPDSADFGVQHRNTVEFFEEFEDTFDCALDIMNGGEE